MTTKLAWNEFNKVPYDTMNWEGIDGSKVFTHMITTLGVGQPETSFFTTYNGMLIRMQSWAAGTAIRIRISTTIF